MGAYERILVPTDGSDGVEQAIEHAIEVAAINDAEVHGIYVLSTDAYAGLAMESSWESVDRLLREDAEKAVARVRDIAETVDSTVSVETAVVEGKPSREIVRYAEEVDCDLVVMGTHGRGGIDRLLLGSVAESVIRASSIPVTTVPVGSE
ncbi:universal stress protein [Haloplanus aerogenes]|uniref:Nucleotide-binding universal stress UspA family protein n=1 Tax=Haloplanus aerogenes TaxID=660522 RepID=A0A3M0DZW3_9EURY|nr:universal stress protein [Haloplanus aerogenes]AZH25421.1 universal stress protein [Haloplanus aerogenes]RMB25133.1 nucleotide-binding universal stress UspA family protein [Haloplanus aerogenes]